MKLTIEHLAPYLPYQLEMKQKSDLTHYRWVMTGIKETDPNKYAGNETCVVSIREIGGDVTADRYIYILKPVLRPLSRLIQEIEVNGETFVPFDKISIECKKMKEDLRDITYFYDYFVTRQNIGLMPAKDYHKLYEWHFDVFGLIDNNLAIELKQ